MTTNDVVCVCVKSKALAVAGWFGLRIALSGVSVLLVLGLDWGLSVGFSCVIWSIGGIWLGRV
jgi:hypothetical protein